MTEQPNEITKQQFRWYVTYVITRRIQVGKQLAGMQTHGSILISLDQDLSHNNFPLPSACQAILQDTRASEVVVQTWNQITESLYQDMVEGPPKGAIKC